MSAAKSKRGARLIMLASLIAIGISAYDLIAIGISAYDYNTSFTGLAGAEGVLVAAVAALLMLLAASVWVMVSKPRYWLSAFLIISILLDSMGSFVCGYFLESTVLMGAMALGLVGWLLQLSVRQVET